MIDRFPSLRRLPRRSRCLAALLLGVALSVAAFGIGCGDYCLFCDDSGGTQGPCDGAPCDSIANAQAGSCTAVGTDDFSCSCEQDFFWNDNGNTCQDPCIGAPCDSKEHAVDGSCSGVGANEYTCGCESGYIWDSASESCADDPCDPDPCGAIANAIEETCTAAGAGDFACQCESGFLWDGDSCVSDPCTPDPCQDIDFAVPGSCTLAGQSDFTCGCDLGYSWNGAINQCEAAQDPCEGLKACLKGCNGFEDFGCQNSCYGAYLGCTCLGSIGEGLIVCGGECPRCFVAQDKACYDCVVECAFANFCESP